ncbi:MAG: DNA mismatch repair protein MutT [Gemmatimonadota bacterium]|nr:DNA mismatch repair protein MutT [Gemmatimonadota bacterium]
MKISAAEASGGDRRTKQSIALVIREPGEPTMVACGPGARWLMVRRPDDDEDLPGVWGLPAGTAEKDESTDGLVRRIGREKLSVELEPGAVVAGGVADRTGYRLEMNLWTATIVAGDPMVGMPGTPGHTVYADWRWGDPPELRSGARQGSLCCRLGLELAG